MTDSLTNIVNHKNHAADRPSEGCALKVILLTFLLLMLLPCACDRKKGDGPPTGGSPVVMPPQQREYEIIVVGAEPEGVAAAVAGARMGAKTLLVERREAVGGLWTLAQLNTLDIRLAQNTRTGKVVLAQRGIVKEILDRLKINYMGWHRWFDVEKMQGILDDIVRGEANLTLLLNTEATAALDDEHSAVWGVTLQQGEQEARTVTAKIFIDGTGDADLVAMLGEKGRDYFLGRSDLFEDEKMMAATFMLHIGGTSGLKGYYRRVTGGINDALFADKDRLKIGVGFNMGWQRDGTILINSLKVYGVNGLDENSVREGLALGEKYAPLVVDYLNGKLTGKAVAGFKNAYLAGTPDYLYIRETRHVEGLAKLTFTDIAERSFPPDTIAIGTYPVDLQPYVKDVSHYSAAILDAGYPRKNLHKSNLYGIPFGSLVPKNIDNLLVVGKCISADSIAAGSVRVVPHLIPLGEAAGIAAAMAIEDGKTVHEFASDSSSIDELRTFLRDERGFLLEKGDLVPR